MLTKTKQFNVMFVDLFSGKCHEREMSEGQLELLGNVTIGDNDQFQVLAVSEL